MCERMRAVQTGNLQHCGALLRTIQLTLAGRFNDNQALQWVFMRS